MIIDTLLENNLFEQAEGLKTAHGLSLHLNCEDGRAILFDAGPDDKFISNAQQLGIDLRQVVFAVLSHAHNDHGGGLASFLALNPVAPVYLHRMAKTELYARGPEGDRKISLDESIFNKYTSRFRWCDHFTEVSPGAFILTEIGQQFSRPLGNQSLYKKENDQLVPDTFDHELVFVLREEDGLVVFTGCSHHGILNMVDAVLNAFPAERVKAVIGGFHLYNPTTKETPESPAEIERIGHELLERKVERYYTGHCTGNKSFDILKSVMGERLVAIATGSRITV